jgi:DHA3 family macrolide efflux protein-like MFS transporter
MVISNRKGSHINEPNDEMFAKISPKPNVAELEGKQTRERLWTSNFFLLWQGQIVSAIGDVVYEIALGFWILAVTGSTALMGTLMAASVLPRVLVSPFAGVWVDRSNRKWLIVVTDLIRCLAVLVVAVGAFQGWIQIWMVFAAGVVLGLCGAFFNPAVTSSLPDIVPTSKLLQANSVYSMVYSGSGILGNSFGGFLYALLGAPLMFLVNGLSFFYSTLSVLFVRIPKIRRQTPPQHFFADMRDGYRFVWRWRSLRQLLIFAACANFFVTIGIVAVIPLFQQTPKLGPGFYGVVMGLVAGGQLLGMLLTSVIPIPPVKRYPLFVASFSLTMGLFILFPVTLNVPFMATVGFLAGLFNAVGNVLLQTVMQLTVPAEMRGKVFSLLGGLSQGLVPIAMALGGVLAAFIPLRLLIGIAFAMPVIPFLPLLMMKDFRTFFVPTLAATVSEESSTNAPG